MSVVDSLMAQLRQVCTGLPDQRKGPPGPGAYTMSDIGLAAFDGLHRSPQRQPNHCFPAGVA